MFQSQRAMFIAASCFLMVWVANSNCPAQKNWPQFMGPYLNGHADSKNLPIEWSEDKNIVWKTAIHDRGWSSPVIWNNQIWMGTAKEDGKQFFAVCVDKQSGKIVHDLLLFEESEPRFCHGMNSYASPTPAIEEGRVYLHFGSYGTACLDSQTGETIWQRRDLPCNHFRGPGSSPMLYKDLLFIHYDGFDLQYVVALNKRTGETVWKTDRDVEYGTDDGDVMKAFCTPIVISINGEEQLISPTSKAVLAYDPQTGKELWRVRFPSFSATARPLFDDGLLYVNTGFGKADLLCIDPTGKGDVTDSHVKWAAKQSVGSKPSSVLANGLIFVVSDGGVAACIDAKTGEYYWSERLGGEFSSSLLYADGKVYFCSHEGKTFVIAAAREFKQQAVNELPGGFMSTPAVSDDALYLRSKTHLYRVENKQ